jgi:hypothetical protein
VLLSDGRADFAWRCADDCRGLARKRLHTIERFTRTEMNNTRYELTIDDPGAYTSAWKTVFNVRFTSGVESFEFICQDGNQAYEPMVGSMGKVDRSSPCVP